MKKKTLVADLLCGAGGSSTGAAHALNRLGLEMDLVCVNHWPVAIETHTINHPLARHYVQDIATVRPGLIVPEGRLDLLMASPSCVHHSRARNGKPTSDQQRSDPWHIVTWLTELNVDRIIIENVWEFTTWGPVDPYTGRPIASRKGEYFHAWIETIRRLGFEVEWRKLNAADYGAATTRQRFILMGRSDGKPIRWPMPTHRKRELLTGEMFADAKPWRSAEEIIDWSLKGKSIFSRPKPLAPKTLARIYAGALKQSWPRPYLNALRNYMEGIGVEIPKTRHTEGQEDLTAPGSVSRGAAPMILSQHNSGRARSPLEPLPTITTGGAGSSQRPGCARPMLVEPFILSTAHGVDAGEADPHTRRTRSISEPLGTIHAGGGNFGIVRACISDAAESASYAPLRHGPQPLIMPVTHADTSNRVRGLSDPLPTVTGANRGELALVTGNAERIEHAQGAQRVDILFRMFEPHELAAAMGFAAYKFSGNKTEQVKQIGNAVAVEMMDACVTAAMYDEPPEGRRLSELNRSAA